MDKKVSTGKRLRQLMLERNLKQVDIIDRTIPFQRRYGITLKKNDLSQYVNDKTEPNQYRLFLLAKALDVDEAWLMGFDVQRNINTKEIHHNLGKYNYFDKGLSVSILSGIDPFNTEEVETITISDETMGIYAGDPEIFISTVHDEALNRIIPKGSMIAIKRCNTLSELKNADMVVFQDGNHISIRRFYNDRRSKIVTFSPDSLNSTYQPISYRYESTDKIAIIGKIVVYTVKL